MFNSLPVIKKDNINVMSSIDLAKMCVGKDQYDHKNFMAKAAKVLGSAMVNFHHRETYGNNNTRTVLMLPEREACLMAMSYSYELQAKVYDAWQALKNAKPSWLVSLSPEAQIAIADIDRQRLEAIATKAEIGSRREATAMNTASRLSKENKVLQSKLQDVGIYQSLIAAKIDQYIVIDGKNKSVATIMKKLSIEMECEIVKVIDTRYGFANTYHVDVINEFIDRYL